MTAKNAIALLLFFSGVIHAADWRALNEEAKNHYVQGQYDKSAAKSREALLAAENNFGKDAPELIPLMNNLARTYRLLNKPAQAEALYLRAATLTEKKHGAQHPALATALSQLAQIQHESGRFQDAAKHFARTLAIREKAFGIGPHHPETAQTRIDLARTQVALGQFAPAEAGFNKALQTLETTQGIKHPGVLEARLGLAHLYKAQKKPAQAEAALQNVWSTLQKSGAPARESDAVLTELVNLQLAQGHYERAQSGLNALADSQARRQAPYAERVTTYEGLASIGKLRNQPLQIEAALKGLLALNEKAKGARSAETLETLDRLVEVLSAQGKAESKRYANQAAKIRKSTKKR